MKRITDLFRARQMVLGIKGGLAAAVLLCCISTIAAVVPPPQLGRFMMWVDGFGSPRPATATDSIELSGIRILGGPTGLPAAVSNVHTLVSGVYQHGGNLALGANQLYVPAGVAVTWISSRQVSSSHANGVFLVDGTLYLHDAFVVGTGGIGIRMNSASATVGMNLATALAPGGVALDVVSGNNINIAQSVLANSSIGMRVNTATFIIMSGSGVFNNATGIQFTGTTGNFAAVASAPQSVVPGAILMDVQSSALVNRLRIDGGTFTCNSGQTCLIGAPARFGSLSIANANFTGAGTRLSGVSAADSVVRIANTDGVLNTRIGAFIKVESGSTITTLGAAGVYTDLLGSPTISGGQQFTHNGSGVLTNSSGRDLNCSIIGQMDGATGASAIDVNLAVYLNGTTQITPVGFSRSSSNSMDSFQVRVDASIPNGSNIRLRVARKTGTGSTITWENGYVDILNCVNAN